MACPVGLSPQEVALVRILKATLATFLNVILAKYVSVRGRTLSSCHLSLVNDTRSFDGLSTTAGDDALLCRLCRRKTFQ